MSGLGAPARTARPIETVASGVSLWGATCPDAITGSSGGCATGTSKGSPLTMRSFVPPPEPKVALTLWPVARSKAGMSSSRAAPMPPGAISVISAARTKDALDAMMTATTGNNEGFIPAPLRSSRDLHQFGGVAAENRDALGVAQSRGIENMIHRPFHPRDGIIGADHDLARAVLVDEMAQRLGGKNERVVIQALQIFRRFFRERGAFALSGEDRAAVVPAGGVGGQEAAAVRAADFQVRETIERALENEMSERERGFERIADHVAERAATLDPFGDARRLRRGLRMDEDQGLKFLGLFPKGIEPGSGDLFALDAAADGGADEAQIFHAVLELLRGKLRKLQR